MTIHTFDRQEGRGVVVEELNPDTVRRYALAVPASTGTLVAVVDGGHWCPDTSKAYWYHLPAPGHRTSATPTADLVTDLGYEVPLGWAGPAEGLCGVQVAALLPGNYLAVRAKEAGEMLGGLGANTVRLYARRGQCPSTAGMVGLRPAWLRQEFLHWSKHRLGRGTRSDRYRPQLPTVQYTAEGLWCHLAG